MLPVDSSSALPRVLFLGTPDLARTVLVRLAEAASGRWEIIGVVAQPDKPVGRGLQTQPPPVKAEALARGFPVDQPAKARDAAFLERVRVLAPDVIVVAAYGQILPPDLLGIPRCGCLNVHTSLLPRWRGAAPIQWAILEGDSETGITVMRMDAGLDTGDIVAMSRTPVREDETGQTLHDRLAELGGDLLVRTLPDWLAGRIQPMPQPAEGVRYARKITREDGRLDWNQPASVLARRVRAFHPWPGTYTEITDPDGSAKLLKIWSARPIPGTGAPGEVVRADGDALWVATGEGALALQEIQREGRRRLGTRDFLAGAPLSVGVRLGVAQPAPAI